MTGNEMFKMVKEECERIIGKVKGKGKKRQKGVLFFINRNRIVGWYEDGDEKKDGKRWNGIYYDQNGNSIGKYVNGKEIKQ